MTRPQHSQLIPVGAVLACFLLAGATLAGWWLHSPLLIGAESGRPQMYPATAFGFLCASGALLLHVSAHGALLNGGRVLALATLAIGLGGALMRATGQAPAPLSLGIGASATAWSLPAPLTAGLFVVLGLSLCLVGARRSVAPAQVLAAGVLLFSLLTLAGFAAEDTVLYQLLPGSGTSLRTALAFMLASGAVLALRRDQGVMVALASATPSSRTLRRLLGPLVLAPVLLGMVAVWAVRTADPGLDLTTMIWLFVWGLLVILVAVVWRLAYQLYRQDLTRSLAERERNQALEALRLADERKNEFLAMLAHELRNPLAPISTAADLLRGSYAGDPAQLRRTSEIIGRQVSHMVHLVDDLLDVSRVTRGIIELERQSVDLRQTVTAALEQVQPLMQMKRQRLRTELPQTKVLVEGDPKRLIQVLANLVGNAAKYTPEEGSVLLTVRVDGEQALLVVQDDGIGIAPELLPDVFGLFTQARRTPDRAEGGLGLGLALVKNLVELHGGRVEAASDGPGCGSTFTVALPLAAGKPAPAPAAPAAHGAPAAARRGNADDVLVVDDNVDAAASLALLLDAEGYRVQVEHAPAPALARVLAQPPGACILDIGLPDMDGRELARGIRAELDGATPLLIALTGYGSDDDRALALDAGFDHYLVKPADMRQLAALLEGAQASSG